MNLKFVYLSKNMPTGHQLLVHPEKGGKMSQKQSTSACTRIRIHSEMGKENKLAF